MRTFWACTLPAEWRFPSIPIRNTDTDPDFDFDFSWHLRCSIYRSSEKPIGA
ncbi:MAG: hypothetical protein ACOX52_00590 [Verrucomicrobiota bacterium]